MASATISSTEILGARLLKDLAAEEGSLEEILQELRTATTSGAPDTSRRRTGIPDLDDIWGKQGGKLNVTGRGLPLLYHVIDHLISNLVGTVAVIDVDGRFSPSHLTCELQHVHVFRPTVSNLAVTLESVEGYMLFGEHSSKNREWVGTVVNGGVGGDIMVGWRGWLRVDREVPVGFGAGVSVEEAMDDREKRQEVVDKIGWKASSEVGEFIWRDS